MPTLTQYLDRMPANLKQDIGLSFGLSPGSPPLKEAFRSGGIKALGSRLAGPAFLGAFAYSDYQQGGVSQAATGLGTNIAAEMGVRSLMRHGGHTAGAGWRSAGQGLLRGGARLAMNPYGLAAAAVMGAGAAYGVGVYAAGNAAWQYHLKSLPLETTGSISAFETSAGATMRQRSMMNIQRSHLNARSAFGNEAQWVHLARYRGIGRRGTR